jgi:hypothetical protein
MQRHWLWLRGWQRSVALRAAYQDGRVWLAHAPQLPALKSLGPLRATVIAHPARPS